ncbi:aminotransferase [Undibacterium sp. KW1]|uniref:pyridoxal phosphate-dependent aminotransferase n=1 Tax=Undibacterium sp. KW1 TaxID=2058624 RepID=UPI001331E9A7|nr:pyridoxal phosphate-dependent aminotransferase [Undibacterium sp. KW1]BBB60985.1 aminotransferase [Undibacterium sp. KW1]
MTTTARFVPESKLPEVGTTIFSVMSALAAEKKAVNLGQGFPDFSCDPALPALVAQAMTDNYNQYPPMPGMPQLREQIATKIKNIYGHAYDVNTEITVTAGATQGILTILLACVHAGDEVIVIEPAYDSYVSSIKLAGGVPVFVSMELGTNGYAIPWEKVKASITDKTRLLMLNSPHNPTGSVLSVDDIAALSDIVRDTRVLIASDEVYEHMVFDGQRHESLSRYPELAERSFIISSFGKTYHVTGWKVGYVTAPAALMAEFRKVHQYNVFTVNTPMQVGLAQYMSKPAPYLELSDFYQEKRDLFRAGLANSRLRLLPCAGTYFQSVDYSAVSDMTELEFARWLTTEIGVAAIPVSAFYQQGKESGIVRFCFAKQDTTLQDALQRLQSI